MIMSDSNLITSKDLIQKTGISRATLNNYIKLGILPKPIVRRPGPEQKGVKQIGYFPLSVLENILKVKLLKQQGNSMDEIAGMFQENSAEEILDIPEKEEPFVEMSRPEKTTPPPIRRRVSDSELKVTIADISSPAYLINHNFEIEWINTPAEEYVFNSNIKQIVDVDSRNIFRLLLNEELRKSLSNWKEILLLHLTVLQNRISANNLETLYEGIKENEIKILTDLFAEKSNCARDNLYHLPITVVESEGSSSSYCVHTMSFREGTFFVYVPTDSVNTALLDMLSHRDKIINDLLRNRMPSLASFCVVIADLQDSVKISAELLPAHYFELINELWQMNAVNCSIEIREVMKELSSKWKLRKGWNNELFLNTGINEGQEFFGTIQSSNNIEFTALGDTINIAARLSDLAQNGDIWTTKNLISRLSQDERNMIRFGVHQENQAGRTFIRNSFSRISDIINKENIHYRHLSAIAGLPITEIKEKIYQSPAVQGLGTINTGV
jgi:DNA-binding transcriptional MerR regulator